MLIVPETIVGPAAITIVFKAPYFAADLSTVTEVRLNVVRRNATTATWTMTIVSATPGELVAQYTFQDVGEIDGTGLYYLAPVLDVPGGNVPAETVTMFVTTNTGLAGKLETSAWVAATSAVESLGPVKREWVNIDDTDSPYVAIPTSPYIAVDLSSGAVTVNLWEGTDGDAVIFADWKNAAASNNLTVVAGGTQLVPVGDGTYTASQAYASGFPLRFKLSGDRWLSW